MSWSQPGIYDKFKDTVGYIEVETKIHSHNPTN